MEEAMAQKTFSMVERLFDHLRADAALQPNLKSYHLLLKSFSRRIRHANGGAVVYQQLKLKSDFNTFFYGYDRNRAEIFKQKVNNVLQEMNSKGIKPITSTYNLV